VCIFGTLTRDFVENNRLVTYAFNSLTTEKDLAMVDEFFKDKDVSKYKLSLAQVRDTIMAQSHWLGRDKEDVTQVSFCSRSSSLVEQGGGAVVDSM
jgi:hypothetical protein